jgi:hypothetical protein
MSETTKPKAKPSAATLATRAFGKLQTVAAKIAKNEAARQKVVKKYDDKAKELAATYAQARADLQKYGIGVLDDDETETEETEGDDVATE